MFIMENTGRKISAARKAKNMTQMELADQLGISFQAVSNWERGVSMPDISKLPELGELLDISIDELLGKSSKLVSGLISEDAEAFLQHNAVDMDELLEAAPILKPEQVDKVFFSRHENPDRDTLVGLLPFLGQEACDTLFEQYCADADLSTAVSFAPFVSSAQLGATALRCAREGADIVGLLPFLKQADVDTAVWDVFQAHGVEHIYGYLPFAGEEALFKIAMAECEANGANGVVAFSPFLGKAQVTQLAKVVVDKNGLTALAPFAPFLDKELLWTLVKGDK